MRSRYAIVPPLAFFTIILGGLISLDATTLSAAARLGRLLRDHIASNLQFRVSDFLTHFRNKSAPLLHGFGVYEPLLLYGGIAVVAAFMVVIMIRTGKKVPEDESKMESLLMSVVREKEKAENRFELKSDFFNSVSHELRAPLSVILGYLECMTDGLYGQIDTKQKGILKVVSNQSNHLLEMIDRVLMFLRLEADFYDVRIEDFPISEIVENLKDSYELLARRKGLEIKWDFPEEEPPPLTSDPWRLKEILNNLMQNAVKFTDQGSVSVRIRYLSTTDSIALQVSDTGVGIPKNSLSTIFDPYVQSHATSSQERSGGFGLGLSIVKKNVEQLHGTIDVESELGKGTVFRIIFPRVYQETQDSPKESPSLVKNLHQKDRKGTEMIMEAAAWGFIS
jgi:signal transduction histidine kinase